MDVLIFIVALLLVGGVFSSMHGLFKPVADWIYPRWEASVAAVDVAPAPAQRKRRADRVLLILLAAWIVGVVFMGFGIV